MTYIKIVILDGLDVAMNPNVAVATAESDEQIREAENKTADASMSNAPTIDLLFIMILLLSLSYLYFTRKSSVYYFFSLNITGQILELSRQCDTAG